MNSHSPVVLHNRSIQEIGEIARKAGCEVGVTERHLNGITQGIYPHFLVVNGHRCAVHRLGSRYKTSSRAKRYVTSTSLVRNVLMEVEAVIFLLANPDSPHYTFVVPAKIFIATYFENRVRGHRAIKAKKSKMTQQIFLPTEKLAVYHNRRPIIDYWLYENAWHLLPKPEAALRA